VVKDCPCVCEDVQAGPATGAENHRRQNHAVYWKGDDPAKAGICSVGMQILESEARSPAGSTSTEEAASRTLDGIDRWTESK
jgi:hypothetical protein